VNLDLAGLQPPLRQAVLDAGAIAMAAFGRGGRSWEKAPGQILTETDLAVDRALKRSLGAILASAAWLSEETADDGLRLERAHVWVVDPIDGTRSFAKGLPEFTISVALVEGERPVLACLLNPATGECFEARAGGGATLNERPLTMHEPRDVRRARIVLSASERRTRDLGSFFPEARVSTIGSLAYKMALVAAGRFDAYFSWRSSHDWDIAAALLILDEAGGRASDRSGASLALNRPEPRHQGLIAAGPSLHAHLAEVSRQRLHDARIADPGLPAMAAPR
jgi:myo-inositol-1(or 4)-monophosphatase